MSATVVTCLTLWAASWPGAAPAEPTYRAELVFPLHSQHNHAPGLVECPNGDLFCSWYRGSGERQSDDVAVYGSRMRRGSEKWDGAFLLADHPGFPDCNTCLMIDSRQRLWLFWPIILDNRWESCITNFLYSSDYTGPGAPKWDWHGTIFLRPDDFADSLDDHLHEVEDSLLQPLSERQQQAFDAAHELAGEKLYQRLGWQPRCKPTVLPSGRILLPLYSDTYSISLMAISDDGGRNWFSSQPLFGYGAIQPTVLRRDDGTLVAYMRENGFTGHIRVCESGDDGLTWGRVGQTNLPNPGAGIDGVRLSNGGWVLVYNDTQNGRSSLAVSHSEDEGQTWKWTRHLERSESGRYHYPVIIQAKDGTIHAVYSYFVEGGRSMKHAAFNEAWIRQADTPQAE